MSDTSPAKYHIENGIAWLSFNRPDKRNCMNPALNRRMGELLDELEYRDDFGVLVLKGEGTAWSAGMDLKEYFRETEAQGLWATRKSQREAYNWWKRLRWLATARYMPAIWLSRQTRRSTHCPRSTGASCLAVARPRSLSI